MKTLKISFFLGTVIVFVFFGNKINGQLNFSAAKTIVNQIERISFPTDTFWVTGFGAKIDGIFDNRPSILKAIEDCSKKGGGVVMLSGGTFFCKGPISLKSNVNLHIADGATLLFSSEPDDYLPAVFTRWEGVEIYNYSPLIYTAEQENVAITGEGIIDGNASETWSTFRSKQGPAQNRAREFGAEQVPVKERIFGNGYFLRPSFVQFIYCSRILVEGVTFKNSPFWILHPVYCSDFVIRNVEFISMNINNDGIDVDSSINGLIEECSFTTGDDAVVFKSGRDQDGWRVRKPTQNIVVRNCLAPQALHGIAFGSELSGGIENIFVENFRMGKVRSKAIQFKANKDRGGYVKNIYIRNVEVDESEGDLFYFTNNYHGYRGGDAPSAFHDIYIENVSCRYANSVIHLQGLSESPLDKITFQNITVEKAGNVFGKMENFRNVEFKRFLVSGEKIKLQVN
jgi:polygalacturonase